MTIELFRIQWSRKRQQPHSTRLAPSFVHPNTCRHSGSVRESVVPVGDLLISQDLRGLTCIPQSSASNFPPPTAHLQSPRHNVPVQTSQVYPERMDPGARKQGPGRCLEAHRQRLYPHDLPEIYQRERGNWTTVARTIRQHFPPYHFE